MVLEKLWVQITLTLPTLQSLPGLFLEPASGQVKLDQLDVEAPQKKNPNCTLKTNHLINSSFNIIYSICT